MKKNGSGFNPEEIIFCPTSLCNLKCNHCFVEQKNARLDADDAIVLLEECSKNISLLKIGFSGGEPFLNIDFMEKVCKKAIELDLVFDRLMTNGIWWNSKKELEKKLCTVRDSGFDGKIGLSFDSFHNQDVEKISAFIKSCHEIFGDKNSVEILSVVNKSCVKSDSEKFMQQINEIMNAIGFSRIISRLNKKTGCGSIIIEDNDKNSIVAWRFAQSFIPNDKIKLKDKKWFEEDYCQSTGNVLYVHSDGNIAGCCGFANERPELFIGNVKDNFSTLIENASKNFMTKLCYDYGLLRKAKEMQKLKILPKGKCSDMCAICWWMCRNQKTENASQNKNVKDYFHGIFPESNSKA